MKVLRLIIKNLTRRGFRTSMGILGIASAMLLFVLVESLALGMDRALSGTDAARTLVVYRKNRYCPQTSFLPEWYGKQIERMEGVESVLPVKVFLNNCRASLDLVTFHGAPVKTLMEQRRIKLLRGDLERFEKQHDAALVGERFALRRDLDVGDRFRFGEVDVSVVGIFRAGDEVDENLIVTHLEYLQRAGPVDRLGTVTQIEVRLGSADQAEQVSKDIDALFATAEEPTDTRPKIAFLEGATRDLREVLRFGRWLGLACVLVVLSLVANTILMSVAERVSEFAVLRTLGFREIHIAGLVLGEALLLALLGALLGTGIAYAVLRLSHLTIGSEGVSVSLASDPTLFLRGLLVAGISGALAGLVPAILSARAGIVTSLRGA